MNQGYYRYPTIAGDRIVFVCEDDLWSAAADGGVANRLTVSFGMCSFPRLSPDGSRVAFVSTDEGNPELYVMPAARRCAGAPDVSRRRSQAAVCAWSPDGSESTSSPIRRRGTNSASVCRYDRKRSRTRPGLNVGPLARPRSGGMLVLGRNASDAARWKRYRGGTSGEIWVDAEASGTFSETSAAGRQSVWPMWLGERIFFLRSRRHRQPLFVRERRQRSSQPHDEREYYVRFPSTDGRPIVYGAGAEFALLDIATVACARSISRRSPLPQTVRRFVRRPDRSSILHRHPTGRRSRSSRADNRSRCRSGKTPSTHHGRGSRVRTGLPNGSPTASVSSRQRRRRLRAHHRPRPEQGKRQRLLTERRHWARDRLTVSPDRFGRGVYEPSPRAVHPRSRRR